MGLFGKSMKEVLSEVAEDQGGNYDAGSFFKSPRVDIQWKHWCMTIDTYAQSAGKTVIVYSRLRVPFKPEGPFNMKVYKKGVFSSIGKALGMQDIRIGDEQFDQGYIAKGNDTEAIAKLLKDEELLWLLYKHPKLTVELKAKDPLSSQSLKNNEQLLSLYVVGHIKDIDFYRDLVETAKLVLQRMDDLGYLWPEAPTTVLQKK